MVISLKGCIGFLQVIPNKSGKYDKVLNLCDAETLFINNLEIYCQ